MRGSKFPREMGLKRNYIYSVDEFDLTQDCYSSIFSLDQLSTDSLDTIYFDIDAHRGENLEDKFNEFKNKLNDAGISDITRIYFTGRGIAVYFDFLKPIKIGIYPTSVKYFVDYLGIRKILDVSVVGDVRRVARIPYSYNSKASRYMVRVSKDMSVDEMIEFSENKVIDDNRCWYQGKLFDFNKYTQEIEFYIQKTSEKIYGKHVERYEYPLCVKKGINDLLETGELDHVERLHVFSFLILNGEEGFSRKILTTAGDYDPAITEAQIKSIKDHNGYIYSCDNVPESICTYKNKRECPYYPNLNYLFKERK